MTEDIKKYFRFGGIAIGLLAAVFAGAAVNWGSSYWVTHSRYERDMLTVQQERESLSEAVNNLNTTLQDLDDRFVLRREWNTHQNQFVSQVLRQLELLNAKIDRIYESQ